MDTLFFGRVESFRTFFYYYIMYPKFVYFCGIALDVAARTI